MDKADFEYQETGKAYEDTVIYDDKTSQKLQEHKKITEIKFYWSEYLMGAEVFYDNKPAAAQISKNGYLHSGSITVQEGEHIVEIKGRAGGLVDFVTVQTSLGREKDFGESKGGQPFKLRGKPGDVIRGLKFGTGGHLHMIGAYFGPQIENKQIFYKEGGKHHNDTKTIDTIHSKDNRITELNLFSERLVYGLEIFEDHHSAGPHLGSEKGPKLTTETLKLEPGENITEIKGRYKDVITQLTFITSRGRQIHGGKKKGKFDISLKGPAGTVVRAFKFGLGGHLHFIGAYFDYPIDDTKKPTVVEKIENFAADAMQQLADIEAKKKEAERIEHEMQEAQRKEAERLEAEKKEAELKEHERKAREQFELKKLEEERIEAERKENERRETERLEAERKETERLEAERKETERREEERIEDERKEKERLAVIQREALRLEEEARREIERFAAEKRKRDEEERRRLEEEEGRRLEEEENRRREEEIKQQQEEEQIKARENASPDNSPKRQEEKKVNPKIAPLPTPTIDISVEEMDKLIFKTGTAGTSDPGDTTFDHFTTIFKKFGFRKLLEFHVYHNTSKILGIEIVYDYPANLTISRKVVDHKRSDIQKASLVLDRDEKIVSIKVAFGAELVGITISTSKGRTLQSGEMNAPETREWSKEGNYLCCFGGSFGQITGKNEKALKGLYAYYTNI